MNEKHSSAVAIVGIGAVMPDAPTAQDFWANITAGRYSISDVPGDRWDPDLYFDPDPQAPDKTYSKIGGWVTDFTWDPMSWRLPIPPKVSGQMDQGQRWAVACTRAALLDAGWPDKQFDSERTAVILGNAIGGEKHYATNLRIQWPEFARSLTASPSFGALPESIRVSVLEEAHKELVSSIDEITEDTMPGELANVMAGRIANVFNFRGPNFTTDAACASGLAAMSAAVAGLLDNSYDVVITGGVDRNNGIGAFVKFCKIGALSATGTRPFDAGADGFVMGEGAALYVLKRLADAERDGDRIYAVLLGLAGSSDGKGKGITAPNPIGQRLAISRAWARAGIDPATATLIEAHGTSTRVGDAAEMAALLDVFGKAETGSVALGSVKSNIGHLKAAAGVAGLFKAVQALHHRVLPPSLHVETPNPGVDWARSPLRVNRELRDWPIPPCGARRAGVSAFGFGGTNFHAVLEEYVPGRYDTEPSRSFAGADVPQAAMPTVTAATSTAAPTAGPTSGPPAAASSAHGPKAPLRGALVLGAANDDALAGRLRRVPDDAARLAAQLPEPPDFADLSAPVRVAIDYGDAAELADKATRAVKALEAGQPMMWRALRSRGVFLGRGPAPKVAFLYTGQGSQYVNMLSALRRTEPIVADTFAEADGVMTPLLGHPLTEFIFADDPDEQTARRLEQQLLQTEITQPAVLTVDASLTRLLDAYGIRPDMVMGHSLGEYAALVAAGSLSVAAALEAVSARGQEMAHLSTPDNGTMAAVLAPLEEIERLIATVDGNVVIANVNSTGQAVIGGATAAMQVAVDRIREAGYTALPLSVSHAFHTSIVAPVSEPLKKALRRLDIRPPQIPIARNVDGEFYPAGPDAHDEMIEILGRQVASPVQFVRGLHSLYDAGARVFVEIGPKKALFGFTEDVLAAKHDDVLTLFTNHPKLGDDVAFNQALCGLYAAGLGTAQIERSIEHQEEHVVAPDISANPAPQRGGTSDDRYLALGHLFADFLDQGRQIYEKGVVSSSSQLAEPVVVTGASVGLPGTEHVFDDSNVARILAGEQFIGTIPSRLRQRMADKNITRLVKDDDGSGSWLTLTDSSEMIKLAGRAGDLDVVTEFGIDPERDVALDQVTRLAIGAGFDALRDAGIPLVLHYRATSIGSYLPDHWMLPEEMQDDTGVIFASAFPGYGEFEDELERYFTYLGRKHELETLQAVRARLGGTEPAAVHVDRRIGQLRVSLDEEPYHFDRRFLFRILSMGHSQFAEIIGARGPNTQINAACASTTQAFAISEDWIRAGRCRRVIVISADDVSSDHMMDWIGAGFLATGAAATDDRVEAAALPFDNRRHGMIIGMGAAGFVIESASAAHERGISPICEVLATVTANSAFHGTRLDVDHIGSVMDALIRKAEQRGYDRAVLAREMVFVSHETYTPARGGSAAAEVNALRRTFGAVADGIVVTNTKGFTGHAMGAGIEDFVAIRALETGIVPPIPNFRDTDPSLGRLNLSGGGAHQVRYALRLAAGFGSQISMSLLRWTPMPDGLRRDPTALGYAGRIVDEGAWRSWLTRVTGQDDPRLEVVQRRLRVADVGVVEHQPPREVPAIVPAPAQPPLVEPTPAAVSAQVAPAASSPAAPASQVAQTVLAPVSSAPPVPTPRIEDVPLPEPVAVDDVVARVLAVVADKTGYPPEMLDLDLDLEADLGIDTVKQAEVFASIRGEFGIPRDDTLKLRDYPTLTSVVGFVRERADVTESAVAPPPSAEAAGPEPTVAESSDDVVARVLAVVADKTGYPPEMLDLDLDLEADLGIDTVKQAEVFASIRGEFGIPRDDSLKLRDYPTLTSVVGFVRERSTMVPQQLTDPTQAEHAASEQTSEIPSLLTGSLEAAERIPRRVAVPALRPAASACAPTGVTLDRGSRVIVAGDRGGVGDAVVKRLEKVGAEVLSLDPQLPRDGVVGAVADWLSGGPITGVYWLPALDDEGPLSDLDVDAWHAALQTRVKSLADTMRVLYDTGAFLVTATRLGGRHGYGPQAATAPLGGAVTGFAKAYKRERPDVLVKAVDVAATRSRARIADRLIEETLRDPGCVEIGYDEQFRWTVGLIEQPAADGAPGLQLTPDTVYVISGAAGGIVSAITADLAAAGSGGTFHLLDLTPAPDPHDPDLITFLTRRDDLKQQVFDRLKESGERVTPVMVERELARIERLAMAQEAISAVERAGGTARYHAVDLTDGVAVTEVMAGVVAEHGRVDVLLHAAGLEISRALADKVAREFDLVFDVKIDGWFHLSRALAEVPVAATVAFSSVAGRFGNAGQTDYSAANDLLCKLTSAQRTSRPQTRSIVIDWTAWGGIGMATRGSIPTVMAQAGIEMLDPAAGIATIRRELTAGGRSGEILVGTELGVLVADLAPYGGLNIDAFDVAGRGPMIGRVSGFGPTSGLVVDTTLDPSTEPFLNHHRIDGTAVLPGVMGIEGFAEVARLLLPDRFVLAVEDVDFREPVKFYRDQPRTVTISTLISPDLESRTSDLIAHCRLTAERTLPGRENPQVTVHFTGQVRLGAAPAQPEPKLPPSSEDSHTTVEHEAVYAIYFHGPAFQVVEHAWRSERGVAGRYAPDLPPAYQSEDGPVIARPRLVELCFQTAGIEELGTTGRMALPMHVDRIVLPAGDLEAENAVAEVQAHGEACFDARVIGPGGEVLVQLEGYRTIALPDAVGPELLDPLQTALAAI